MCGCRYAAYILRLCVPKTWFMLSISGAEFNWPLKELTMNLHVIVDGPY